MIRTSGVAYGEHVLQIFDMCVDLPTAIETAFVVAAAALATADYADACPIATIALEVASTNETLRQATADVFTLWISGGVQRMPAQHVPEDIRRRLMFGFVTSLEGAFVLARSLRSPEPLWAAGQVMRLAVEVELARASAT